MLDNKEKIKEILLKHFMPAFGDDIDDYKQLAEKIDDLYNPEPEKSLRNEIEKIIWNTKGSDVMVDRILEVIREEI